MDKTKKNLSPKNSSNVTLEVNVLKTFDIITNSRINLGSTYENKIGFAARWKTYAFVKFLSRNFMGFCIKKLILM